MRLVLLTVILFASCSNNSGNQFETRIKNYMTDSVVVNMNDPKSYEFVSMEIDSVYNHKITKEYLIDDSTNLAQRDSSDNVRSLLQSNIDRYKKELSEPDYLYRVYANVKFRAKNKLGALVLDDIKLSYNPKTDKIQPVKN